MSRRTGPANSEPADEPADAEPAERAGGCGPQEPLFERAMTRILTGLLPPDLPSPAARR